MIILHRLYDFEEDCVEGYFAEQENKLQQSTEERIKVTTERIEHLTQVSIFKSIEWHKLKKILFFFFDRKSKTFIRRKICRLRCCKTWRFVAGSLRSN